MFEKFCHKFRRPLSAIAVSLGLIPFLTPKQQPYTFNFDRTINFFEPAPKWPVEKLFTPVEKQVYEQMGRPDYFHILWNPKGEIRLRATIEQEWNKKGPSNLPPVSWVYVQRGEQVMFSGNTFFTQPLNDTELLVLKSGDPESNRDLGNGVVEWTYYSTGKIYTISGNKIVGTKEFPPMGSFHK